jgi:GDP-mannose 6-dehydrogenase
MEQHMRISVFGLGYVGAVSAACLARDGHDVVGVDPNPVKVDLLNSARSPVIEEHVEKLIAQGICAGNLRATTDCAAAIASSDLAFVCVGTPGQPNGSLDLSYVERVSDEIGRALRDRADYFLVVMRSTMLPGSARSIVVPRLEQAAGKRAGEDFGVCVHPEFLREGSAVDDYDQPSKVVIGADDERSRELLTPVVERPSAPLIQTSIEIAEITKYVDNSWHALKVAFANEIGTISKAHGLDGREVMDVFCADEKLNLSPTYLRPGFAFGGSCLPKDVRAITHKVRSLDLDVPVLNAVLPSNQRQLDRAFQMVFDQGRRRVGVLGLSFKAGTDDLRESPMVDVVERLIGKGYDLRIFDHNVNLASLVGANRDYILNSIPHIADLMVPTMQEVLDHAETLVIGNRDPSFREVFTQLGEGQTVIDFASVSDRRSEPQVYDGICW